MALQNIRQRLAYAFGEDAQMFVLAQASSFQVTLMLPLAQRS